MLYVVCRVELTRWKIRRTFLRIIRQVLGSRFALADSEHVCLFVCLSVCFRNHTAKLIAFSALSVSPHHCPTSLQDCSTRSSSVVTLSRPPSASSLRITDRSFRYASPRLWNQLTASLRQPRASLSILDSDLPTHTSSDVSINSPLSTSITPSLFHSQLKTYLFHKSFPP